MTIRFQADADLNQIIVKAVLRKEPDIDFKTSTSASLAGVKDFDVLTIASKQNRVLVTHDYHTMPRYFGIFITTKQSSGVIIVSQKMPITQVVDELIMIWLLSEADEWVNRIVMLPL